MAQTPSPSVQFQTVKMLIFSFCICLHCEIKVCALKASGRLIVCVCDVTNHAFSMSCSEMCTFSNGSGTCLIMSDCIKGDWTSCWSLKTFHLPSEKVLQLYVDMPHSVSLLEVPADGHVCMWSLNHCEETFPSRISLDEHL